MPRDAFVEVRSMADIDFITFTVVERVDREHICLRVRPPAGGRINQLSYRRLKGLYITFIIYENMLHLTLRAGGEIEYTQGLGPCAARREGSSPSPPTLRLSLA